MDDILRRLLDRFLLGLELQPRLAVSLFAHAHLHDALHELFLLLLNLLLSLLLLRERCLHRLPDQLLLCLSLRLQHLFCHLRSLPGRLLLLLLWMHHYLSSVLLGEVGQLRCRHHLSLGRVATSADHAHGLLVELRIPFDHELLEGHEAVHGRDLVDDLLVQRVRARLLARLYELLLRHAQLRHQLAQQIVDHLLEAL